MKFVGVVVKGLLTGEQLQVTREVCDQKSAERQTGDRHDHLLTYGRRTGSNHGSKPGNL